MKGTNTLQSSDGEGKEIYIGEVLFTFELRRLHNLYVCKVQQESEGCEGSRITSFLMEAEMVLKDKTQLKQKLNGIWLKKY